MTYTSPKVTDLGSLVELTQQKFNKIGPDPDMQTTNPSIVGSVTPV